MRRLRRAFPRARLRIRLDAGFSGPELYAFFEAQKVEYLVGMAKNAWLTSLAEPLMAEVRSDFEPAQQTTRRYGECAYQAGSWPRERRVIVKAEVAAHFGRQPKDSPRFVVTNLKTTPRHVYEAVYCARGDVENRLKDLKLGLEIDRSSCARFLANQFVVGADERCRLCADAGASPQGPTDRVRTCPGQHLAATLAEAGGVDRVVGLAHRHPLTDRHAVRRPIAPHRAFGRCCRDLIRTSPWIAVQTLWGGVRLESGATAHAMPKNADDQTRQRESQS